MNRMLLSLRHTVHNDFSAMISALNNNVQVKAESIQYIESKMSDLYMVHNELIELIDAYRDHDYMNYNICN